MKLQEKRKTSTMFVTSIFEEVGVVIREHEDRYSFN
jgi:hypothetical protein